MNLLPNPEKENLKKGLKLRLIVVAAFFLAAFFLAGSIMLLPSYFLIPGHFFTALPEDYFSDTKNGESVKKILNLPEEIDSKLKFLQSNVDKVSAPDSFSKIIGRLPSGVTLESVSFGRAQNYKEKTGIVISISGTASDRGSLVAFSTDLKESKLFSAVDMPVSSLTRDKNLPFSINIFIEEQK